MRASLVDHGQRPRTRERRRLQIERPPGTRRDIVVDAPFDERGGQQIERTAAVKVLQRANNIVMGEVHEAVPTQYDVRARQWVSREVRTHEAAARRRRRVPKVDNELRDDVESDVLVD